MVLHAAQTKGPEQPAPTTAVDIQPELAAWRDFCLRHRHVLISALKFEGVDPREATEIVALIDRLDERAAQQGPHAGWCLDGARKLSSELGIAYPRFVGELATADAHGLIRQGKIPGQDRDWRRQPRFDGIGLRIKTAIAEGKIERELPFSETTGSAVEPVREPVIEPISEPVQPRARTSIRVRAKHLLTARQTRFEFERAAQRADRHHELMAAHVQDVGDQVVAFFERAFDRFAAWLRDELLARFTPTQGHPENSKVSSHLSHVEDDGRRDFSERGMDLVNRWKANRLMAADLLDAWNIDTLHRHAISEGKRRDDPDDRIKFFNLCVYCAIDESVKNAGALLTGVVFNGKTAKTTFEAENRAKEIREQFDRSQPRSPELVAAIAPVVKRPSSEPAPRDKPKPRAADLDSMLAAMPEAELLRLEETILRRDPKIRAQAAAGNDGPLHEAMRREMSARHTGAASGGDP